LQTFSTTQAGVQESNGQKCGGRYDKISGESLTLAQIQAQRLTMSFKTLKEQLCTN